jgi:hypothetical protein
VGNDSRFQSTGQAQRSGNETKKSRFPKGWDGKRVREVLAHFEAQSEEEAVAEDEAAAEDPSQTLMEVPNELVPEVRELVAARTR